MSRQGSTVDLNDDADRFRFLCDVLDELKELTSDHVLLVEGKNDRIALEKLIGKDFRCIEVQQEGGPLVAADRFIGTTDKAVILTDWDRKGRIIAEDLMTYLRSNDVEFDTEVRRKLSLVCKKDIKDVEKLYKLYERLSSYVQPP